MILQLLLLRVAVASCFLATPTTTTTTSTRTRTRTRTDTIHTSSGRIPSSLQSSSPNLVQNATITPTTTATATTTTPSTMFETSSSLSLRKDDGKTLHSSNKKSKNEPSPLSKLIRRIRVFLLASQVFLSYKFVKFQEKRIRRRLGLKLATDDDGDDDDDHPAIAELWNKAHEDNARRILKGINSLQGFWIKVGQYLSSRADIMPKEYLQILASLQDGVPSKPYSDVQSTLSEQLSEDSVKQMIRHIDTNPLSTASLAQVHRATLQDGRDVVLKVQHRGVASLMLQDMENLRTILRLLAMSEPDMDYNPIADEYTKEVQKELDFRAEAENMIQVKKLLAERQIRAIVPNVIPELVTEKVLVMDYCEGFPIRDIESLDANKVDRQLLLERVCKAWAAQMHNSGVFNADPHPGNILVSTKNEENDASVPILLDFGLTKRFTPDMKVAFSRLVHASNENDIDSLLQSFDEMGLKLNRYDPFQDMQAMQSAFADPAPQSEASDSKKQRAKERKEKEEAMRKDQGLKKGQKLRNPVDAWPSELIFFSRVSAMLRGLCSRLEVRYPYLACMAEAASETLRESIPKHEHASGTVYQSPDTAITTNLHKLLCELAVELVEEYHAIGMQVCVIHKGEIVANVAAGTLGTVNPRPVKPNSLFNVFSVSKAVLAAGVLCMLEEKGISVDDSIAKYWPKFGASHPLKKDITIRQALSHQAGLANAFPPNASIETLTDWEHMKNFISGADAIPAHKPGTETHYHYLSFAWILGGLIEEVTGEPYETYLSKNLIEPFGLTNELHMGGLPEEIAREELAVLTAKTLREPDVGSSTTSQEDRNEETQNLETRSNLAKFQGKEQLMNPTVFNMSKVRAAKIPSANGHASAQALAMLMYGVICNGILSTSLLQQAASPQESAVPRGSSAMLDNSLASFGLGFQLHEIEYQNNSSAMHCTGIGHSGFGGSVVLSIPELQLSVAFTTNQLKLKSVARTRVLSAVLDEFGLDPPKSLIDS